MVRINIENGYYLFKLEDILNTDKISKNKLMRETNTDFKVLQRIIKGEITKIDVTVFARLCDYLDCKLDDIVEYVPNEEIDEKK
jgi:putative transcriptional regulator